MKTLETSRIRTLFMSLNASQCNKFALITRAGRVGILIYSSNKNSDYFIRIIRGQNVCNIDTIFRDV